MPKPGHHAPRRWFAQWPGQDRRRRCCFPPGREQARPVVTDRDLDLATGDAGGDFDDAARRRVFGSVFQQVAEHALHQHRVQFQHWQIARQVDAHAMAAENRRACPQRRADGVNGIRSTCCNACNWKLCWFFAPGQRGQCVGWISAAHPPSPLRPLSPSPSRQCCPAPARPTLAGTTSFPPHVQTKTRASPPAALPDHA